MPMPYELFKRIFNLNRYKLLGITIRSQSKIRQNINTFHRRVLKRFKTRNWKGIGALDFPKQCKRIVLVAGFTMKQAAVGLQEHVFLLRRHEAFLPLIQGLSALDLAVPL